MNSNQLMKTIHRFFSWNLDRKVRSNPILGFDIRENHNQIESRVNINFGLKTVRILLLIFNLSFFVGLYWYLFCEISMDIHKKWMDEHDVHNYKEFFIEFFKLDETKQNEYIAITMMYYAFTSMSTVGFGDYHPRSDAERIVCAFILLFGVTIFSYIMGVFMSILAQYNELHSENEDQDGLSMFFCCIQKLNGGNSLNPDLMERISKHFSYSWEKDKNYALDEHGMHMMRQLPIKTVNHIFQSFLH